jgi:hypothetical protein
MADPQTQRDYFAELYVAGIFGDAGWSVYFPKRDVGFDFVVSRSVGADNLLRPVQVKGLYPTAEKGDKASYGYSGRLTAVHPDMVLVLPYFAATERGVAPACIAYMPRSEIRERERGGFRCVPGRIKAGIPMPRRDFRPYFNEQGLASLSEVSWGRAGT